METKYNIKIKRINFLSKKKPYIRKGTAQIVLGSKQFTPVTKASSCGSCGGCSSCSCGAGGCGH
jgi:hypothetical protein